LHRLPFYGLAVLCLDDPAVRGMLPEVSRPIITYGTCDDADLQAHSIVHKGIVTQFSVAHGAEKEWLRVTLNLPGRHNVLNALAAIAVAHELEVAPPAILKGLAEFQGIGRRFQVHGEIFINGASVTLVDDYGHHPTEIAATLAALRAGWPGKRIVVAFQPHRYTRTRDLLDDFARVLAPVDALLLLEVYAAGERPIVGADGRALARAIRNRAQVDPIFLGDPAELQSALSNVVRDGDALLILGAGNIGGVVQRLVDQYAVKPRLATVVKK
jgi:UDP-N-acetylmuramate--alanine ligase